MKIFGSDYVIHANHYDFGIIFMLFNSNYAIMIVIVICTFYCALLCMIYECPH